MVTKTLDSLQHLYRADETAWLDAMAELIRAGRLDDVDYPHLAEYLEDMANRDRKEVSNRLRLLMMHLLKWIYQAEKRTSSWRETVVNQQAELEEDLLGGVLLRHAEESLAAIYQKAIKYASRETKLPLKTFPKKCPWTLEIGRAHV